MSPLPGFFLEHALVSYPITHYYHRRSLHQEGVDFMDCNPDSDGGNHHIIVVVDYFMKWEEVMPTIKSDGDTTAHFVFNHIITQFRIPKEIITDHGSHFYNSMMEELALVLGFNQDNFILITPKKMIRLRLLTNLLSPFCKNPSDKTKPIGISCCSLLSGIIGPRLIIPQVFHRISWFMGWRWFYRLNARPLP